MSPRGWLAKKLKRVRNPPLYDWLVENYDRVKPVVGEAKDADDLEYARVRWMWVESLPADYKGKVSTPLGVMLEWSRVRKEVEANRKLAAFAGRSVKSDACLSDTLSQTDE